MGNVADAVFSVIEWRFGLGLAVGCALTLRYVVVGIYHPIIREQIAQNEVIGDETGNNPK